MKYECYVCRGQVRPENPALGPGTSHGVCQRCEPGERERLARQLDEIRALQAFRKAARGEFNDSGQEPREDNVAKKTETSPEDQGRVTEARDGYGERLAEVRRVKAMTDTPAWQDYYARLQEEIRGHAAAILDAEKPRDVVRHQEGVKILRSASEWPRRAVDRLASFCSDRPLFRAEFPAAAEFSEATGRIEIREART